MSGFAASKAQRAKCRFAMCCACGKPNCQPAHLIDRSLGGCDHPDCVIPLCGGPQGCHRRYDEGTLDLSPYLEPGYRQELAHGLLHVGLHRLVRRVTNSRSLPEAA